MTRYEKGHKEQTHQRLVKMASERFRRDGIDGVGIATLMGDAGLTHGGFYAHFKSKEALVREAISHAVSDLPRHMPGANDPKFDLRAFIDWYLSPAHRDHPGKGCPIASLAPDLARRPRASKIFSKDADTIFDRIARGLSETFSADDRRARSISIFAQLVGCIQLARLAPDKATSDKLLEAGRQTALGMAGLDIEPPAPTKRSR